MASNNIQQNANLFICESCDFICSKQSNYSKHIMTRKHSILTNTYDILPKNATHTCACGKQYKHRQSLYNHKKECSYDTLSCQDITNMQSLDVHKEYNSVQSTQDDIQTTLILELVKQNQEFKELLIQQNNQLLEQNKTMIEVAKNSQINNTINNNINNNNKTFNLQVFLNETCKDAMNIKDFIQSLELTLSDLEKVGELGYAEGISRMFIKGLNNLDITKRPIHCSDVKREIMHIKHEDKWEKDNAAQDKLRNIIKQLTHKNIMMLDDWKKANPGCTTYDSKKYDRYLKLTLESMGPTDDDAEKRDFNKIIRRVAENTTIDKKYLVV
jgi:hypothetical protein